MSATRRTFGPAGRNWRSTRSSATPTPGTRIVVRPRLTRTSPERLAWRMSRLTRGHTDAVREAQLGMDAPPAVDAAVVAMNLLDALQRQASVRSRSEGAPRSHAEKAERLTPSRLQATETGKPVA